MSDAVNWPAVVVYAGDDELLYVSSLHEWLADPDLSQCHYEADDMLIALSGNAFQLKIVNGITTMQRCERSVPLNEMEALVKRHLSQSGHCCVSKLSCNDFIDAFTIIQKSA